MTGSYLIAGMSPSGRRSLRLIVQYRPDAQGRPYRLVAYADGAVYLPQEFASPADLARALRAIVPELEEQVLSSSNNSAHPHIVFAADVTADDAQLHSAGLISG